MVQYPATTNLPSVCICMALIALFALLKSVVTMPPVPNELSTVPSTFNLINKKSKSGVEFLE